MDPTADGGPRHVQALAQVTVNGPSRFCCCVHFTGLGVHVFTLPRMRPGFLKSYSSPSFDT